MKDLDHVKMRARFAREAVTAAGGLVSLSEIARRCEASKSSVQAWTQRDGFPEPMYVGGQEKLWLWFEVVAWRSG